MCAGEGPCLATFFVKRYWQLLVLRILTGISVGGTFPLVFSLVCGTVPFLAIVRWHSLCYGTPAG